MNCAAKACAFSLLCIVCTKNRAKRVNWGNFKMSAFDLLKSGVLRLLPPKPTEPTNRCHHHYDNRSRCQLPIAEGSTVFCGRHSKSGKLSRSGRTRDQREAELAAVLTQLYGPVKDLDSAVALNHVLSNLFRLTAEGRVAQRKAALLTYMSRQLLNTVHSKRTEISNTRIFPSLHPDIANLVALLTGTKSEQAVVGAQLAVRAVPEGEAAAINTANISNPESEHSAHVAPNSSLHRDRDSDRTCSAFSLNENSSADQDSPHGVVAAGLARPGSGQTLAIEDRPESTATTTNRATTAATSTVPNPLSQSHSPSTPAVASPSSAVPKPGESRLAATNAGRESTHSSSTELPPSHRPERHNGFTENDPALQDQHLSAEGPRIPAQRDRRANLATDSSAEIFRSENRGSTETRKNWFSKWFSKKENPASPDHRSADAFYAAGSASDDLSRADFAMEARLASRGLESSSTNPSTPKIRYTYAQALEETQRNSHTVPKEWDGVCWIGPKPDQINWARLVYEQREYERYLRETYGVTFDGHHLVPPDRLPLNKRRPR
jgi:hypothetical protein